MHAEFRLDSNVIFEPLGEEAWIAAMPLETDNPFWRFSLAVYAEAGVREACLAVQDRLGGDINLLLCCAWLGSARGVRLDDAALGELAGGVAGWNAAALRPLRSIRRAIRPLAAVARRVAALELRAEQIAQAMLYGRCAPAARTQGSADHAAANVGLYMTRLRDGAAKPVEAIDMMPLIDAASAYRAR